MINNNTNLTTPKILIVDDDFTSSLILEAMLETDGFRVVRASGGVEGRSLAKKEKPDLVLMDVNMPDENGFEACEKLKCDSELPDIPVIFITSMQDVASKLTGFEVGGVDYITKPYEQAEVTARIRLHLRLRRAYESVINTYSTKVAQLASAQKAIMPTPEDVPSARFSVVYRPLHEVGGDFYDVVRVGEDIHDFVAADIGGHNLGTSLATAGLKALLHQDMGLIYTPAEVVKMLNDVIRPILMEEQYLTLAYIRLNRSNNTITMVNAGHPPAIVIDNNGNLRELAAGGDMLGAFEHAHVRSEKISVSKGDRFFIYTDGAIEMDTPQKITRGQQRERLRAACAKAQSQPIDEAAEDVLKTLLSDGSIIADDLLLLAVEV